MVNGSTPGNAHGFLRLTQNIRSVGINYAIWSIVQGVEYTIEDVEGEGKVPNQVELNDTLEVERRKVGDYLIGFGKPLEGLESFGPLQA
jgi:hypothetical protein